MMPPDAAHKADRGFPAGFRMAPWDRYQLEALHDQVHEVDTRFAVLRKEAETRPCAVDWPS